MAAKTSWTIADYLALEEPDGPHFELSEGELIMSPGTTFSHNEIRDRLNARLRSFLAPRNLGVVTSESDFQLGPATIRRPDVAFIRATRFAPAYGELVPIPVAPDLVIEVVSTHDRPGALLIKVGQYLSAGTQAVWLLYPKSGEGHRYAAGDPAPEVRTAEAGDLLDEPALLPGFSAPLREIFHAAE